MGRQWRTDPGLRAGLVAGAVASALLLGARLAVGLPTPADLLEEAFLRLLPGAVFSLLIDRLGFAAKPLLFLALLAVQVLLGGALGLLWARLPGGWGQRRPGLVSLSLLLWLLLALSLWPRARGALAGGDLAVLGLLGLVALAYSLTWRAGLAGAATRPATGPMSDRRRLLRTLGIGALAVLAGGALWRALWEQSTLLALWRRAFTPSPTRGALPPEITPNEAFYTVSKNLIEPRVNPDTWRLEVTGLVERPYRLTLAELRALPAVSEIVTLECISNQVGGDLIGTARWTGVRLRDLLERAGVKPGAVDVVFRCADDYTDSIPLAKALDPATLIAYEMNGEPLPVLHGFPARAIVPGIYGMKHAKFLTRIEVVDHDFQGFWEAQGWSDTAVIKTMSQIFLPARQGTVVREPLLVGGIAFAGDRGISRVEYSLDGGRTWRPARLKAPLSPYTWVFWLDEWTPPQSDRYTLLVRAYDGQGRVQTAEVRDPFPDGASGYHQVVLRVVDPPAG